MANETGDNLSEELEAIFQEMEQGTPTASSDGEAKEDASSIENTKAFAQRLKERTDKAEAEERENIAKEFGYQSWADYLAKKDNKLLEEKGLDPAEVSPVVEEIVKRRMDADPRMKELESYRAQQARSFAENELKQLSELLGEPITSLEQIPKDVIDDWKQSGSLKSSYIKLHGEEAMRKMRSRTASSDTQHLQSPNGAPAQPSNERPLTEDEKRTYRFFNPKVTDEELNKMTRKF